MPEAMQSQAETVDLQDPALMELAQQFANGAFLAMQKAVAHHDSPSQYPIGSQTSLEAVFSRFFEKLPPATQQSTLMKVKALLSRPLSERTAQLGNVASISINSPASVLEQVRALPMNNAISLEGITKTFGRGLVAPSLAAAPPILKAAGLRPQAGNTVFFSVDSVTCDQVTGQVGLWDDNISLGGIAVDAFGNVTTVAPIQIGTFSKNTTINAIRNPFASFAIDAGSNWPKKYSVTLVLDEQHSGGGIYDALNALAAKAKEYVTQAITTAATTGLGILIGAIIGSAAPVVGTVIGAAVGAFVGWVVDKFWGPLWQAIAGDTLFNPLQHSFTIAEPGTANSGEVHLTTGTDGHGGKYEIWAHWGTSWGAPNVDSCWHMSWADGSWSSWDNLGGVLNFEPALTGVAPNAPGWVTAACVGTDDWLYVNQRTRLGSALGRPEIPPGWSGWNRVAGPVTSGPGVVAQSLRTDIVARGTDNAIWHYYQDLGGGRTDWVIESLGGKSISAPAICSMAPGRLDVFTIGTDKALWHTWWDGQWSDWESLGGGLTSGPSAVCWGPGRVDVVARGLDRAVWHIGWDGTWQPWQSLGGGCEYRPTIASWGQNRLDVFIAGLDLALWHSAWDGSSWSTWESLGGVLTSAPAAASDSPNRIDVIARM